MDQRPCDQVKELARDHLCEIDDKILSYSRFEMSCVH